MEARSESCSPSGIIIEGITGAGKSHTLKALCANEGFNAGWAPYDVFREKETFGEFMGELMEHPDDPPERKFLLLQRVITTAKNRAQKTSPYHFILERAHYSYYALLPEWALYQTFDDDLRSLNAHIVLLWIPPDELKRRSLYRVDRREWGAGFVAFHGDEAKALARFEEVQQLRYEGIKKSSIPHTVIDTSEMDWESYTTEISHSVGVASGHPISLTDCERC
jgi:thymidylate kinase